MGASSLGPLQLGVQRVQHVELHRLEEAVTLVLKDERHHHLTPVLQVALDVAHLTEEGGGAGVGRTLERQRWSDGYEKARGNAEII